MVNSWHTEVVRGQLIRLGHLQTKLHDLLLTVEERTQKSDVDMLEVRNLTTRLRNQTNELKNRDDVWKDTILLCNELEQLIGNRNRQQKMFSGIIEHLDGRFWTALEEQQKETERWLTK